MAGQSNILDAWVQRKIGLLPGQALTQAHIQAYQLKKMGQILKYVQKASPFYRRHLKHYCTHGIKSMDQWASLPLTTAADLRKHGLQMLCVSQSNVSRVVTLSTSGTMGPPKRLYFTTADQGLTVDYFARGMATFTSAGEKVAILLPVQRPGSVGDMLARALNSLGAVPIKFGPHNTLADTYHLLTSTEAQVVVGVPVQVLAMAKYHQAVAPGAWVGVKKILLSTDYVAQALVDEIKNIWGCQIYRYLGMTEMGWGGGIECARHRGYHLYQGDFIFEIVHPVTSTAVPPGTYGEVVLTTLTRQGMPLVRYATGDIARLLPEPCGCGSVLARLSQVKARKNNLLWAGSGSISMGDLDEILLGLPGVVDFTAAVLPRPGPPMLRVEVLTLGNGLDLLHIQESLKTHPVCRCLLENRRLQISGQAITDPAGYQPRVGKRKIAGLKTWPAGE